MTDKQKRKLEEEIRTLLAETEDKADAEQYIEDVISEVGCTLEEALAELNRQA